MNFAKALRILRAAKGVSQQELAEKANLSKSFISKVESGSRTLNKKYQKIITKTLKVPEDLLNILALEPREARLTKLELEKVGKLLLSIHDDIGHRNEG